MQNFDVIVIGAGVAGIGCTAMLDPSLSVLVLEQEAQCAYHASGRSAAIFIPGYGGPEIREFTRNSEHYLANAPEDDCDSFLQPRGELVLATKPEASLLTQQIADAATLQEITLGEAVELVPILDADKLFRVAYDATARDIDVDLLLQCWQKKIRRGGRQVLCNQQIHNLTRVADRWQVITNQGDFFATVVVNAAGAWADSIATLAGAKRAGLTPCRRTGAIIPAPGGHKVDSWPAFAAASENWYAKPTAGKLMVSPADEDPMLPHDAFADDLVLAEGIDRYENAVTVGVERVEHTWAGLRTFASDRVPVVGYDPEVKGFFWLAGHGGYGMQTSPALSAFAAALVNYQTPGDGLAHLVEALSPVRFKGNS